MFSAFSSSVCMRWERQAGACIWPATGIWASQLPAFFKPALSEWKLHSLCLEESAGGISSKCPGDYKRGEVLCFDLLASAQELPGFNWDQKCKDAWKYSGEAVGACCI